MKSRITVLAAALLWLPLLASAAELAVKPGMWETTMTRTHPLTGEPTTETNTRCVQETSFNPSDMMADAEGCELLDEDLNGDTLTFRMECSMEEGMTATVNGEFQSDGDSGSGSMDMNMDMGEMKMTMDMEWTSKRVGDCP